MLLDALVNIIDTVQKRIGTHRQALQQNETRTRMALIDPLLTALGWDVSDPSLVMSEYSVGKGRADYALMKESETIPAAIVEAKRLGHTLDDEERMQMLNYANARGVRYAAITDGSLWELYEVFKHAPLEDRRRLNLTILGTPAHKLALQLLLLWRPNLASGGPVAAQEPVLGTRLESAITETLHQPVDRSSAPPDSAPPGEVKWVMPSEYNPPSGTDAPKIIQFPDKTEKTIKTRVELSKVDTSGPKPEKIRFPDETEEIVKSWTDLLRLTGKWLSETGKLNSISIPVFSGPRKSTRVLDDNPSNFGCHSVSKSATKVKVGGNEFWLNTHGNPDNMQKKTRALLSRCGVSLDDVLLLLADHQTP